MVEIPSLARVGWVDLASFVPPIPHAPISNVDIDHMKVLTAGGVSNGGRSKNTNSSGRRSNEDKKKAAPTVDVDSLPTNGSNAANAIVVPPPPPPAASATLQSTAESGSIINDDSDETEPYTIDNTIENLRQQQIERASMKLDDLYYAQTTQQSSPKTTVNTDQTALTHGHCSATSIQDVIADEAASVQQQHKLSKGTEIIWLISCFSGIMGSFVAYGLLLEYATSGGKHLHELSFLFVTSLLYTVTASVGRYIRREKPSTIPPAQFAVLGLTSMGSTFFSVRALRYVIFPIQVLAKSCKPVPVMLMGAVMGKRYPLKKYLKVGLIVAGVGLFMGGGDKKKKAGGGNGNNDDDKDASSQLIGIAFLFISLCFDGGTGAYEDKLMSVHSVGPFDLMYNIQLGKTILAGIGLIVLNQVHIFARMVQDMGFLLVALGLSGAIGQVFIFITIAKFGALTCAIIGLARKVATLVASIYFYGHTLNHVQAAGLCLAIGAMINDFFAKNKGGGGHGHGSGGDKGKDKGGEHMKESISPEEEERRPMLSAVVDGDDEDENNLEMGSLRK